MRRTKLLEIAPPLVAANTELGQDGSSEYTKAWRPVAAEFVNREVIHHWAMYHVTELSEHSQFQSAS